MKAQPQPSRQLQIGSTPAPEPVPIGALASGLVEQQWETP